MNVVTRSSVVSETYAELDACLDDENAPSRLTDGAAPGIRPDGSTPVDRRDGYDAGMSSVDASASSRAPRCAPAVDSDLCGDMFGASPPMQEIFKQIRLVAALDFTLMIEGESGTGKELAARALHRLSGRSGAFVAVNCGAVAPELLASQLFGHERGSFTGAVREHHGVFEQARHGTLFLDEVTDMPYSLQAHLLRAIESRTIRRVGADHEQAVDCRIVAATNCPSRRAVNEGRLREDLFYRLTDFVLRLPPLRELSSDILALAQRFLDRLNTRHHTAHQLAAGSDAAFRAYAWPGNVRELKQIIQRAYVLCGNQPLHVELPDNADRCGASGVRFQVGMTFDEIEQRMLRQTLLHFGNDKTRAAAALGVSIKTIYNRLARSESVGDLLADAGLHLSSGQSPSTEASFF